MGQIVGTIAKSVLVAVIGSAATILINQYWGARNADKFDSSTQFSDEEHHPNYRF